MRSRQRGHARYGGMAQGLGTFGHGSMSGDIVDTKQVNGFCIVYEKYVIHTFASVLPPSTSICLLTFGASLVARASLSIETEGTSVGSC
jgi:hypothetical protein